MRFLVNLILLIRLGAAEMSLTVKERSGFDASMQTSAVALSSYPSSQAYRPAPMRQTPLLPSSHPAEGPGPKLPDTLLQQLALRPVARSRDLVPPSVPPPHILVGGHHNERAGQ